MAKYTIMLFLTVAAVTIAACNSNKKNNSESNGEKNAALLKADADFAVLSEQKGLKEAFLENIDSNGVLLRPDVLPIAGADAVDYIIAVKDTGYTMLWKPSYAEVAVSGELGYTYGVYQIKPSVIDTVLYGTYVSIWKKQPDGKWKFVLQSNNEGIGAEE
ncbi:MAG: YybH family protein [Ferruginibacter sp.]